MAKAKIIVSRLEDNKDLSSTAASLLFALILHTDDLNVVNKKAFIKSAGLNMDPRTWRKYWTELLDAHVLTKIDNKAWMISPNQCYTEGVSHQAIHDKWNLIN